MVRTAGSIYVRHARVASNAAARQRPCGSAVSADVFLGELANRFGRDVGD